MWSQDGTMDVLKDGSGLTMDLVKASGELQR